MATDEIPRSPDRLRWYAWQVSLRSQPPLIRHAHLLQLRLEVVSGIHPAPLQWLRVPLCTVGSSDEISYADAREVADVVAAKLPRTAPGEFEVGEPTAHDGKLTLAVRQDGILSEIEDHIRAGVSGLGTERFYRSAERRIDVAVAENQDALHEALRVAAESGASEPVTVGVLGVSHVLLNPTTYATAIWTNLDVYGLRDSTYPG